MRILFVYPNIVESPKDFSTGLATLAAVCKKQGHQTSLIDSTFGLSDSEILNKAKKFNPDLIAITTATNDFDYACKIASLLKQNFKVPIIAGGFHPTIAPEEVISKNYFDIICIGEGEKALIELIKSLEKGKLNTKIKNLWFKKTDKQGKLNIIKNSLSPLIQDLDNLPFPDRELFDYNKYLNWNHKTLSVISTRGCPYQCSYCFSGNNLIQTERGIKKIKEIVDNKLNLKVLTHSGEWKKIINYFKREYTGNLIKIKTLKIGEYIESTEDHEFLIHRRGKLIKEKAKNITKKDRLCLVIPKSKNKRYINIYEELKDFAFNYKASFSLSQEQINNCIDLFNKNYSTRKIAALTKISKSRVHTLTQEYRKKQEIPNKNKLFIGKINKKENFVFFDNTKKKIQNKIKLDSLFMKLAGYYLAEGSVSICKSRANSLSVIWSFGKHEEEYINETAKLIKKIFGIEPIFVKDKTATRVVIYSNILGRLFKKLFGDSARTKKIPAFFMGMDNELLIELLVGWLLGDGDKNLIGATASNSLAYQLHLIAYKMGFTPGIYKVKTKKSEIEGREINYRGGFYMVSFATSQNSNLLRKRIGIKKTIKHNKSKYLKYENYILLPIKEIKQRKFEGFVYNLEVEKDHTYTVNNLAIKNCINHLLTKMYKGKGKYVRFRSINNIFKEIKQAISKYEENIKNIEFYDDTFTLDEKRINEFCKRYPLEIGIPFNINARVNAVNPKLLKSLKKAGCVRVSIGVEAGDPEIRNNILKRNMTDEQIINTFKSAKQAGLKTYSFNMIGLPFETKQTIKKTIELNRKCQPDFVGVSIFNAFKGTEIYDLCKKNNLLKQNYSKSYFRESNIKNPNFTQAELKRIRNSFGFRVFLTYKPLRAIADLIDRNLSEINSYIFIRSKIIEKLKLIRR